MHKALRLMAATAAIGATLSFATPTQAGGGLKVGEYSCSSSGRQTPLMGLAFKVVDGSRYTDLDNTTSGTYQVNGDKVYFHGGHLDGQVGEGLENGSFAFNGGSISCGPW